MKAPQKTPGTDKAYFKNFWSKTIFSKLWSFYMKGKSVKLIPDTVSHSKITSTNWLQFSMFILDSHIRFYLKKQFVLWLKQSKTHTHY